MSGAWTLDDALSIGQGIERPFRCPSHDDTNASASVNVLKGVWYCYACNSAGTVDGKKAPTAAQLSAMLNPEESVRFYSEGWLDLFNDPRYWLTRFPQWLCWYMGLGEDPFTGDATFPVRTPEGRLAGVGRRLLNPEEGESRYKYPIRWSASRTLGGYELYNPRDQVGILVEGRADESSLRECGFDAFACYGSGLHAPQRELVMRLNKKLWLFGFDMDEAGEKAAERAQADLEPVVPVARIEWKEKDPADTPFDRRVVNVHTAVQSVRRAPYSDLDALIPVWLNRAERAQADYTSREAA